MLIGDVSYKRIRSQWMFVFLIIYCTSIAVVDAKQLSCVIGSERTTPITKNILKSLNKNCKTIEGNITITLDTDLSSEELKSYFGELQNITGSLYVVDTKFKSLDFLDNLQVAMRGDFLVSNINISSNKNLVSLGLSSLIGPMHHITIRDNVNLDLGPSCEKLFELFGMSRSIAGNKENCGCDITESLSSDTIHSVPDNCSILYGKFQFNGPVPKSILLRKFRQVQKFYGDMSFYGTNIVDLSFFVSLEEVDGDSFHRLTITDNHYLTSWFPKLKRVGYTYVSVIENAFSLCLTMEQIEIFTENAKNNRLIEYMCPGPYPEGVCTYTGNLMELDSNCSTIVGDLTFIDHVFQSEELERLKVLEKLFGQLMIVRTNIENMDCFSSLQKIYFTFRDDNTRIRDEAIFIAQNEKLSSLKFANLTQVISSATDKVHLNDIYGVGFTKDDCFHMQDITGGNVLVNWKDCFSYEEEEEKPVEEEK